MPAQAAGLEGLRVEEAIRELEARGLSVVYSSDLVRPEFRVLAEPAGAEPAAMLREILRPYQLDLASGPAGRLMVVRAGADAPATSTPVALAAAPLAEIVVTASRYQFTLSLPRGARAISSQDLELLPELADDPVRAVGRLPGVASPDFSSKPNVRGGVSDETLVRFDGLRLYDPYHLKDFLSLTSAIDPNVVEDMTVFTAAFPVSYGDRLSGVIDIVPVRPGGEFGGRVAASLFNLSALAGGPLDGGAGDWIAAVRRGNLDLVLDVVNPDLGRPAYADAYARVGHQVGPGLRVTGNLLLSDDDLRLYDSDQEEEATAEYRDQYYWLTLDAGSATASGARVLLAHTRLASERAGTASLPGVGSGRLDDRRRFTIGAVSADGWWTRAGGSRYEAGFEWRRAEGRYDYADEASFELLFLDPGAASEPKRTRTAAVRAAGDHFAAYANWRYDLADTLVTNVGLRWDRETLSTGGSSRVGPRLGVLWRPDGLTRIRAGWGQFFQAQNVNELAVADGDTRFHPGQRADHWVLGLERTLPHGVDLRAEAFRKDYDRLKPRYENLLYPLVVLPELKPDRVRVAADSARADGVELSVNYTGGALGAWANYSWARVRDRSDGRSVPRSWDQEHAVGAGVTYRGSAWDLSLAGSWHSGWPTTAVELATLGPLPLVSTGPRNAGRLGDYLRFDLRVARRFEFESGDRLSVFLELSNLANRRNDCCVEYQLEDGGGMPYLDVAAVKSLPLVPSIGLVWSF